MAEQEKHSVAVVLELDGSKSSLVACYPSPEQGGALSDGEVAIFNREVRSGEMTRLVLEGLGRAMELDFEVNRPHFIGETVTDEDPPQRVSVFQASINGAQLVAIPRTYAPSLTVIGKTHEAVESLEKGGAFAPLTAAALKKYIESVEEE